MKLSKLSLLVAAAVLTGNTASAASGAGGLDVTRVTEENTVGSATSCIIMSGKMESQKNAPSVLAQYINVQNLSSKQENRPSLLVQGRALCLGNLNFGTKYKVTLKKGMISAENTMLLKDKEVEFTTVDHQGVVQFLNGNIISSSSSDKKVAVQTVNLNKFRLSLFKISDSDRASYFGNYLGDSNYRWGVTESILSHGKFIGSKDINVDGVKNQKTVTMVDLKDLTDEMTSGSYMLILTETDQEQCDASLDCIDNFTSSDALFLAKSIIVTDLGVTTYLGSKNMDVAVRSLTTAEPVAGAKVSLISRSNEILKTVTTDRDGYAHFSKEDISGAHSQSPVLVSVVNGKDSFIQDLRGGSKLVVEDNFTSDTALASSDDINVYSYTNRTLVRPGEKVLYEAIVRDGKMKASDLKALKLMIVRPDDQIYREVTLKDPKTGAFEYEFEFDETALTGNWEFKLGFDKKRIISTTSVKVDNFMPSSIKAKFKTGSNFLTGSDAITVNTRFIYDAPAPDVAVSGNYYTSLDNHPVEKYSDFYFGPNEYNQSTYDNFDSIMTDRSGNARIDISSVGDSSVPRKLTLNTEIYDPNSKILNYTKEFKLAVKGPMIGIKNDFSKINPNESDISVILADQEGKLYQGDVSYSIFKRNVSYQYVYRNGSWEYIRNEYKTPVTAGTVSVKGDTSARIKTELANGNYLIQLNYADAETSSYFYVGSASDVDPSRPDRFSLFADKKVYKPGETARLEFDSYFDGYADLMLDGVSGKALSHHKVTKGHNTIDVKIGDNFSRGSYAIVSLYSRNDSKLGAQRAIGITYLDRDSSDKTLNIAPSGSAKAKPNSGFDIELKVDNADSNTYISAALVDEGILSINNQKSPSPDKALFGQYSFNTGIYDAYAFLMKIADAKSQGYGGDDEEAMGAGPTLNNVTRNLFSYYVPATRVDNGVAKIHFDLNDVSTTARLMVTGWSSDKVGSYSGEIPVKDIAVTRLNSPHYIRSGDQLTAGLTINNLSGSADSYTYKVTCRGVIKCSKSGKMDVSNGETGSEPVTLTASGLGDGFVDIDVKSGSYTFKTTKEITSVNRYSRMTESRIVMLKPHESKKVSFLNTFEDSSKAVAKFGTVPMTDLDDILKDVMDSNGYGVFDEVSTGMILLDVLKAAEKDPKTDKAELQKITKRISTLVAAVENRFMYGNITNSGYMDSSSETYATASAATFLYLADRAGFNVSRDGLAQLRKQVVSNKSSSDPLSAAVSLYALARMGDNVHTEAVYMFDNIANNMSQNREIAVESMSYFAQIFGMYGDSRRQKDALKLGVYLFEASQIDAQINFAKTTYSQIAGKLAVLLKYYPTDVNTATHDSLSLIRAAMFAEAPQTAEKLYNYINADTYLSRSSKYLLNNMAINFKGKQSKAEYKTAGNSVTVTNPTDETMVATVAATGNVTGKTSYDGFVNMTQTIYTKSGQLLKPPYKVNLNDDLLVVNTIEFSSPYSGNLEYEVKIPSNTLFIKSLTGQDVKKLYPKIYNDTFGYPSVFKGDTAVLIKEYVGNTKFKSFAYTIKGAYVGSSMPLMSSVKINKVQSKMFNFYDAANVIQVK
jgi:uncharacterized protein YfaS (alpha-2-macroglobulin family)